MLKRPCPPSRRKNKKAKPNPSSETPQVPNAHQISSDVDLSIHFGSHGAQNSEQPPDVLTLQRQNDDNKSASFYSPSVLQLLSDGLYQSISPLLGDPEYPAFAQGVRQNFLTSCTTLKSGQTYSNR